VWYIAPVGAGLDVERRFRAGGVVFNHRPVGVAKDGVLEAHDRFGERVDGGVVIDRHRAAHISEVLEADQGLEVPIQPNL
jgi:hypothetical protein